MTNLPIRLLLAAGLCCASTAAMAQALQWQVSESAGPVTIRHGGADRPATRGAVLAPGDAISTGAGGRAVLVHERDFVTLAPRSRTTVPAADQASGFTKLLQDLGNAVYKIEKRGVPHFGVTTPYLAAVVKGTTFSVTVDTSGTSLQVVEGAVEVATPDGGARDLIRPGSVATIAASDLFRLRVHGDEDRVVDSAARPGGATPSTPPSTSAPAPAAGPVAAPTASLAPVAPLSDTAVGMAGPEVVIATAITSKPVDLGQMSGGLVTGTANVGAVTAAVTQAAKSATVAAVAVPAALPVLANVGAAPAVSATPPAVIAAVSVPVAPAVTTPVVAAVTPAVPVLAVAAPVIAGPATTSAAITTPVVAAVATVPTVAAPVVTTPVAAPVVAAAAVTVPAVTIPVVTVPAVTAPVVVKPVVTIPVINLSIVTPIIRAVETLDDDLSGGGKGNNGNHNGWGKNGKGG